MEKAECKYAKAFGHGAKFKRVRDLARVSIEYGSCREMMAGIREFLKLFKDSVIEFDNRFSSPTPLGWRDFAALVALELPLEKVHQKAQLAIKKLEQKQNAKIPEAELHFCSDLFE